MTDTVHTSDTNSSARNKKGIFVWDLPVRLFHWSLALTVGVAAITGFLAPEWWLDVHVWSGYIIGLLVVFRIIWGFGGSKYARFSSFWFSFSEILAHLRNALRRRPSHYSGHNPAGALMVFALLAVLAAITISGMIVLGGQENQGLLAGFVSYNFGEAAEELHEFLAILLLFMIGAHLLGVFIESRLGRENLVRAMITGYKSGAAAGKPSSPVSPSILRAMIIIAIIVFSGGASSWALSSVPPSGVITLPVNADYASECGDCHNAFHPSLLPAASWQRLMSTLPDHFGEDASLDEETGRNLAAYLKTYASEHWDTEAANNFRHVAAKAPLSITATPYWKRRHADIAKPIFKRKAIASKSNCAACHKDAASGRFDDQMITIPQDPNTAKS